MPFSDKTINHQEIIDELFITIAYYHIVLFSEFVPSYEVELREGVGFSLIVLISILAFSFLVSTGMDIVKTVMIKLKPRIYKRKIAKQKQVKLETRAA